MLGPGAALCSPSLASAATKRMPPAFDLTPRGASPPRHTPEKASRTAAVNATACLRRKISISQASTLQPKRLIPALDPSTNEPSHASPSAGRPPKRLEAAPPTPTPRKSLAPKLGGKGGGALLAPDHVHEMAERRDPSAPYPTLDLDDDDGEQGAASSERAPEIVVSRRLVDLCEATS
jgi:hypothetical protein